MNSLATAIDLNVANIKPEVNNVESWYKKATVRATDRIIVPETDSGEFIFPRSRQIISTHPLVEAKGKQTVAYILAQSAYQYMYEIGLLETRFVIDCSLNIVNGIIDGFSDLSKREALAVVIDEGYHAYVALDFIMQMKEKCGIEPIEVPYTNGNLDAVNRAYETLDKDIHYHFQLISVTLAEHTLTRDLLSIGREKDTTQSFTQVMTDHVSDEGRHANYFATATTNYWAKLPEAVKVKIGNFLPGYLDDYLAGDSEREFDHKTLKAAGFSDQEVSTIIEDTNEVYLNNMNDYITKTKANLVNTIKRMGMLEHQPTRDAFIAHGIDV
jgi:hypothetical protein